MGSVRVSTFSQRLQTIRADIQSITSHSPTAKQVRILAVSKAQPAMAMREAFSAGQTLFGENYVQEALNKQNQLADLAIEWHFIGPIQSNKTQAIAQHFSWAHSVDRLKIAQRLNDARNPQHPPLQICIQVNVSGEASKSGVNPAELAPLAHAINKLPHLTLRGLMAIPAPSSDKNQQRAQFKQVRECYDALLEKGFSLDTLSMGMSEDYPVAIEQGATIVRLGTALFGARNYH